MLFYLLSKSPRDGSENESPRAGERAPAAPCCIRRKPRVRMDVLCLVPGPCRTGEVAGEHGRVLPSHPTHLASSALGKNKAANFLGWVGVTVPRAEEMFITSQSDLLTLPRVSQQADAPCRDLACDSRDQSHRLSDGRSHPRAALLSLAFH